MDLDQANRRRDLRLRRRILQLLDAAKVRPDSGWASGRFVFDLVDGALPGGQQFEDDHHALALLRDLISAGYVQERDDRTRKWQKAGLDWTSYRITSRGTALVNQAIEPDPLVEDDRPAPREIRNSNDE